MIGRPLYDAHAHPDLEAFRSDDERAAREALDRLWGATRGAVLRRLTRRGLGREEAEDVAQRVALKLWRLRRGAHARTRGEWHSLVLLATARLLADHWAEARPEFRLDEARIPVAELSYLDAIVVASDQRDRVYEAADRLWLGETEEPRGAEIGAATVLAHLASGLPLDRAAALFGAGPEDAARWVADPAVVARAMFRALCWTGEALSESLLASNETGWSPLEARVVAWRARYGMREDQILGAAEGALDEPGLNAALDRYRAALPFEATAKRLHAELATRGVADAIRRPGLWRRIAFEYAVRQELPHRQIVERAGPPATAVGVRFDLGTLNNWLSMGRLYAQLAAFLAEEAWR